MSVTQSLRCYRDLGACKNISQNVIIACDSDRDCPNDQPYCAKGFPHPFAGFCTGSKNKENIEAHNT